MNGSAVTLDKVEIQISASAGKASSNISQLTETLSALRSATKGGFNNLSKLAESLEQLKTASESLDVVKQNLSNITELTNSLQRLSDIPAPKGLNKIINNIQSLPEAFSNINTSSLENVTRVSNQLSDALTPLSNKLADIASGYSAVSKLADTYGVSITKVREYTKQSTNHTKAFSSMISNLSRQLKNGQKANENFFKSLSKNTSSVISKIKQIGLSLLGTRTIFTATRKAVSEYMNMDAELTWKITNNWKALGAQLAPAIENVTWLFKQFVRVIYSIILALTGVDLIARANEKAMKGWGKSAKDTLGNLQKFDDLNVVEFPKGKGDENSLIDLDPIDLSPIQKVIDWVKKLRDEIKKALDTKKWSNVGKVFAKGLNGAMKAIDFDYIEEKFTSVTSKFGDFLRGVVSEFDWSLFGEKLTRQLSLIPRMIITFLNNIPWGMIGQGINDALKTFDPYILIDAILGSINTLILGIQSALLRIDGSVIGEKISDTLIAVQNNINNLLANIKWGAMWDNLTEAFNNINWEQIGENLATSINLFFKNFEFSKLVKSINTFVHGLFVAIDEAVVKTNWKQIGEKIGDAILSIDVAQLVLDIAKLIDNIIIAISDLFIGLGKSILKFIVQGIHGGKGRSGMGGDSDVVKEAKSIGERFEDGMMLGMIEASQGTNGITRTMRFIGGLIKGFFGIHSPSTWARDEIGKNISIGLSNGLSGIWSDAKKYFDDFITKVKNVFSTDTFKKIATDAINAFVKGFNGISSALKPIFITALNGIIGLINNMIDKINSKLSISISGTLSSILSTLGTKVSGGKYQLFSIPKIPALYTGTNEIEYEGIYHLHPGESVVPKKYNPALGGGTNQETNERLDRLIDILENMDTTTIVNLGNKELLKQQQKYNKSQNDKYGTDITF